VDLLVNKVEEGKKKLLEIFERFPKSKLGLQSLDHRLDISKVWINRLVHQIQLMTYGNGMMPLPFRLQILLLFMYEIHSWCLSQIVQFVGSIMHTRILLLHHVVTLTTYFAWLYVWRTKPLFMLMPLVGSL
jgi:hypothetical protein